MKDYKVISLDIWDTVLRRRCHPDEIKLSTARFLLLSYYEKLKMDVREVDKLIRARIESERLIAEEQGQEGDGEYEIRDVFARMLSALLIDEKEVESIVDSLYRYELEKEVEMCYLDPEIVSVISRYSFERLGYISDFYAGHDFIDELLNRKGFPFSLAFRCVSCDYKLNKRSGRLFQAALKEYNISPSELLHIGDNAYSDVKQPQTLGIHTLHYLPADENSRRREREECYSISDGHNIEKILSSFYPRENMNTASELALFFTDFIVWIIEDCMRRGIRKIFYFTREGEFFIQLHDIAAKSGMFPQDKLPEPTVLEVSRVATFAASLREVSLQEMMRIWNQYSIQSMQAFGKSLGLENTEFLLWLNKYGVSLNEIITYPWQDERIQRMFADDGFKNYFSKHIAQKKKLLEAYLMNKGIDRNCPEHIAIVDIGWRGSIQDNICYVLPDHKIIGYYLALENFLNEQPINSEKLGFLNCIQNYRYLLRIVAPIEMLCNSPNGSTVGYEYTDEGCKAIRKKEEAEDRIFERYTSEMQKEILKDEIKILEIMNCHSLMAEELREPVCKCFAKVLLEPQKHKKLVKAFFQLKHNEEFGVGAFVDKHTHLRLDLFAKALFGRKGLYRLNEYLCSTSWPQGYLVKYGLGLLVKAYNQKIGIESL